MKKPKPKKKTTKKSLTRAPVPEMRKFDWSPPPSYYNTNAEIRLMISEYGRLIVEMPHAYPTVSDSEFVHDINRYCERMMELAKQLKQDKS